MSSEGELHKRSFIITGTQTGRLPQLTGKHYTTVEEYYPEENSVISRGSIRASSESMTHGTIYDLDESVRFVFHAHSSRLWENSERLGIPITKKDIEYGTPEMAREVERLFEETDVRERGIFSMGGHEDGIISLGSAADKAGIKMLRYLDYAMCI